MARCSVGDLVDFATAGMEVAVPSSCRKPSVHHAGVSLEMAHTGGCGYGRGVSNRGYMPPCITHPKVPSGVDPALLRTPTRRSGFLRHLPPLQRMRLVPFRYQAPSSGRLRQASDPARAVQGLPRRHSHQPSCERLELRFTGLGFGRNDEFGSLTVRGTAGVTTAADPVNGPSPPAYRAGDADPPGPRSTAGSSGTPGGVGGGSGTVVAPGAGVAPATAGRLVECPPGVVQAASRPARSFWMEVGPRLRVPDAHAMAWGRRTELAPQKMPMTALNQNQREGSCVHHPRNRNAVARFRTPRTEPNRRPVL